MAGQRALPAAAGNASRNVSGGRREELLNVRKARCQLAPVRMRISSSAGNVPGDDRPDQGVDGWVLMHEKVEAAHGLGLSHALHTNSRFGSSLMKAGMLPR